MKIRILSKRDKIKITELGITHWLLILVLCIVGTHRAESQVEAWVQRYGNFTDSNDRAVKVVTDNVGNVFVAGNTHEGLAGNDWLIIKYSGSGMPLWTNRYDGAANNDDQAKAAAVDNDGNVVVTGYSVVGGAITEYATIKYSTAGVPLWTNRYNSGNSTNQAQAVALDGNGNVFVTGISGGGSSLDYATVGYSAAGIPLWTNRYNGPGNSVDQAQAIGLDNSGNVFVTGYSLGSSSSYDYATIAYSAGSGVPLWTNRYNGPSNTVDQANAMAVDGSGTVFVTGWSWNTIYSFTADYLTIAYSAAGVPLWTNRHNGPLNSEDKALAVAVDSIGNVFVTGYSSDGVGYHGPGYGTIAYSGAGVLLWTNGYHGPGGGQDQAQAIVVDSNGNVFVTGYSVGSGDYYDYATIAYSGAGIPLWTNRYTGQGNGDDVANGIAVNGSGVFVTGALANTNGTYDFATIAYSIAGVPLWTNRYNGSGAASDVANTVLADGVGSVFVVGYSGSSSSSEDYATIKYSSGGTPLWTNRYNGPGNRGDRAQAGVVDSEGNVIVTGFSAGSSSEDYLTIKYSGAGVALWTNRYGTVEYNERAEAIAVGADDKVCVTGFLDGDYATVMYSKTGTPLWTNRYNGPGNNYDSPEDVASDNNGNVFVTGFSSGASSSFDYATIAYSGGGVPLWTNRYNGPLADSSDYARDVAVDANGNIFVTGDSEGGGYASDFATIKYSDAGLPLWIKRYNGPVDGEDGAAALAVDTSGNVFVTGYSTGSGSSIDYATIKYSGTGVPLWTNRYNGPGNGSDYAQAVAVDAAGNVFVTGYSDGNDGYRDYATVKYSSAGVPLWTNRYNGVANGFDWWQTKQSLALGLDGGVYVTGGSDGDYGRSGKYDFATVKYWSGPLLAIERSATDIRVSWLSAFSDFTLQQNTSGVATINWSNVTDSIQDDGTKRTLIVNLPAGARFYRLFKP